MQGGKGRKEKKAGMRKKGPMRCRKIKGLFNRGKREFFPGNAGFVGTKIPD